MATGTTALPSDPLARAQLYVSRLAAVPVAQRTSKQKAELARYQGTVTTLAARQANAVQNQIVGSTTQQQAAAIAASGIAPGQAATPDWAAQSAAIYAQSSYNAAVSALGPNAVVAVPGTKQTVPLLSAQGQAIYGAGPTAGFATAPWQSTFAGTPAGMAQPAVGSAATSSAGGVPTPTAAGTPTLGGAQSASPYVPTLDQSGAAAAGTGGGAGGGGVDTSGTASPGISSTAILVVAGAGAYLLLHKKKKGGKLL